MEIANENSETELVTLTCHALVISPDLAVVKILCGKLLFFS